jgi:hypothetical protein
MYVPLLGMTDDCVFQSGIPNQNAIPVCKCWHLREYPPLPKEERDAKLYTQLPGSVHK